MGKGDTYRPVDKAKYDRNYLRVFGRECPECSVRFILGLDYDSECSLCRGLGYVEKDSRRRRTT